MPRTERERDIDCGWGCGHPWVPTPYLKCGMQYALPVSTSVLLQREGSPSPPLAWPSSTEVMLLDGSSLHEQFFVDSQTTCEASRFPHPDHKTPPSATEDLEEHGRDVDGELQL